MHSPDTQNATPMTTREAGVVFHDTDSHVNENQCQNISEAGPLPDGSQKPWSGRPNDSAGSGTLLRHSVFVVMVPMFGMAVPVVEVIDVIPVLRGFMGAVAASVAVLLRCVFGRIVVFVVVTFVLCMAMPVVQVVDVVPVLHGCVRAITSAVRVFGEGVFCLDFLGHDGSLAIAASRRGCCDAVPESGRWCHG